MNGTLKIKIEGLNANKVINKLIDSGIYLKNIKEKYKYIQISQVVIILLLPSRLFSYAQILFVYLLTQL